MGRILVTFFYQANRRTWNAKLDHTRMVGWEIEPAPGVDDWRVEITCPEEKKLDGGLIPLRYSTWTEPSPPCTIPVCTGGSRWGLQGWKAVPCRGHDWRYNVTTGNTLHVPDYGVATYPVKVVDGKIMVALDPSPTAA